MALYRETATGFVQEHASNPGSGYTLIASQPTDTTANRVAWWRTVDKGAQASSWHPSEYRTPQDPAEAVLSMAFSKDAAFFSADSTGAVTDAYLGGSCTVSVTRGGSDVTHSEDWTLTKVDDGCTSTLTKAGGVWTLTITSVPLLATKSGYVRVTATRAGSTTQVRDWNWMKVQNGADGVSVRLLTLSASAQVFQVAKDGTNTPASITFTALAAGALTGTATWETTPSVTLTGTGTDNTRTLSYANMGANAAVTVTATLDGYSDQITVVKVGEGVDAITIVIPNDNHTFQAANDGTVSNYAGSGTTVQVYEGITALTASASATVSAFRIGAITQSPAASLTVGTVTYAGATATIPAYSGFVAGTDSVVLTVPITVYRANGTSTTVNRSITLSKSKAGAQGNNGVNGTRTAVLDMYKWAASEPTTSFPSGTSLYTWATGAFTAPGTANGWSLTPGASTPGHTLWACSVTYADTGTGATSTVTWNTSTAYAVGAAGADGTSAKVLTLSATGYLFRKAKSGVISPTQIDLTAQFAGALTGTATWETTPSVTLTGTGNTKALTSANFGANTSVKVRAYIVDGSVTYEDSVTIALAEEGTDAITAVLANEAHTFPAGPDGTVSSYTGSGTEIRVYAGATLLDYDATGTANGTWKVTPAAGTVGNGSNGASNITIGAYTASGTTPNRYLTVGAHAGVAAGVDLSSIDYTITGKSPNGTAFSLVKRQSFGKSKTGADGNTGTRGSRQILVTTADGVWSDLTAWNGVVTQTGTTPVLSDLVTIAKTDGSVATSKFCTGNSASPGVWTTPNAYINGSLLVTGTVGANQIAAGSITADRLVAGTLTADLINSGTIGASTIIMNGATSILKSSTYVAGSAGWQLQGDGSFEANSGTFKNVTVTGTLTAATTFSGIWTAANIPSLNASKITAGTIDASVIGVTNLNASNINTGTLSATRISGGTLNASLITVTNLSASSITTGTLNGTNVSVTNLSATNITGGTLSVDRISANSITGGKISTTNGVDTGNVIAGAITDSASNFYSGLAWVLTSYTEITIWSPNQSAVSYERKYIQFNAFINVSIFAANGIQFYVRVKKNGAEVARVNVERFATSSNGSGAFCIPFSWTDTAIGSSAVNYTFTLENHSSYSVYLDGGSLSWNVAKR